jgi:predicted unusual protein kinase regulating ubiquinone biosynthesis (AarF/ABC1/UbiB family)
MKSKNFLIMEFIDGEQIEQLNISDYKKQILVGFIAIFMKDTFVNGKYIHCDLHQANWKIYKQINNSTTISNTEDVDVNVDVNVNVNYKIVIYDFGYVIENSANNTFKNLAFYLDTNDINGLGNLLYNNIKNIDTSNNYKEDFMERFKSHDNMIYHTTTDKLLLASVNMCYINGYKLNNNLLDYFVSIILLNKYFKKYLFLNDESSKEMLYKHIYNKSMFYISICEKYNVFHEIKNNLYDTYIKNSKFSVKLTYRNNYLNSLKKTNYDISLAHNTTSIDI